MKLTKEVVKNIESENWYSQDQFKTDCKRYIKAIKDGRMLCVIESVSRSGMSRNLKFVECAKGRNGYNFQNFNMLFIVLGFNRSKNYRSDFCFRINGCGMDMVFHTNYSIIHQLCNMNIITKKTCSNLAQKTPVVL